MKLSAWLSASALSDAEFGRRIGVTGFAVARYARGQRIPRPEVMAAIQRETAGQVTAADFYASPEAPLAGDAEGAAA